MQSSPSFAIVIPAYNEAATIRDVAERACRQGTRVVVIDDASTDATAAALDGLDVTLLRNETNLGKAGSLWRGFEWALGQGVDLVVTLDGDGQHEPEDISRLLSVACRYPRDIIIGSRLHDRAAIPKARYRANRFANFWIAWASGYPIQDSQSGFRIYPAALLKKLDIKHNRERCFVFESEVLITAAQLGFRSRNVPIAAIYRPGARKSHFRPVLDIARITRMVAGKLLARGMYLPGLYRSLTGTPAVADPVVDPAEKYRQA